MKRLSKHISVSLFLLIGMTGFAQQQDFERWSVGGGLAVTLYPNVFGYWSGTTPGYGGQLNGSLYIKKWWAAQLSLQTNWGGAKIEGSSPYYFFDNLGNVIDTGYTYYQNRYYYSDFAVVLNTQAHLKLTSFWFLNLGLGIGLNWRNLYKECYEKKSPVDETSSCVKEWGFYMDGSDENYYFYQLLLGTEFFVNKTWSLGVSGELRLRPDFGSKFDRFGTIGITAVKYL